MYCVIQEIELKKEDIHRYEKELEVYKNEWIINGVEVGQYCYRYTGGKFERPIRKAYKISLHKSYREDGKVKKKQYSICTMSYYDIADNSTWIQDYMRLSRWDSLLDRIGITEDDLCNIVYKKLDPLIEQIQKEFKQTEEYKTREKHRKIINKYLEEKQKFKNEYASDSYDYYYDVFGVLREPEKFEAFKQQYEASKTYQSSYQESYYSNYNSYNFNSSYSTIKQSNYTEEEKGYLKKIYRAAAAKLHPDVIKDDGKGMKFLNDLKEQWGI